ncbi:cardiolipin synthase [Lachnotalea glycerini]|uniref:Cardiolipin synthase n=1 Tax=Lachnotalea glycerini TaxID=1763509 RepID=A0A255IF83_9FIRM|nr:cardiolipin synthase [Lachnotalea glycerini]PXV91721.1 cardiolipin synthase [Lachnotalea glycerini]RDY30776.1 cardiolipin synthase [Lachnotalea glycerini]
MEIALQSLMVTENFVMDNIFYINLILSVVIVFFQRKDPKSVWAWLLVMYFIPIVGFIMYMLVGQDLYKRRMFRTKEIADELNSSIRKQEERIFKNEFKAKDREINEFSDLILYNLESADAVYTDDNDVEIYTNGNDKFDAMIEEINQAEKYIHVQYYIIKSDEVFDRIMEALIRKANEGVEVRVLYDSMGCRNLKRSDVKKLRENGIMTAEFFPAFLRRFHLRINYRNHRKIVVIDGKTAFLGGFNVGKEYIGKDTKFGNWRDTHLKISGSAVTSLGIRFILDWNYAAKENLFKTDKYFETKLKETRGNNGIQIISSGPDSISQNIRNNYVRMINKAKNNIYIQSPYFIPDDVVLDSLKIASMSGIDVRVMIPCMPDHPFVYWATYSYMSDLLSVGAKCYTYDDGFLHAKGMVIDGKVACYGTANMDIRSFKLNFEVNATIYSMETAAKLENIFMSDLAKSTQITPYIYANRPLVIRIKEQVSRLLSPLL